MNNGWVKALLHAGPIGAIVAFLLLQSAGIIPSTAGEIKSTVERHEQQAQEQLKVLQDLAKSQAESTRLQRLACLRVAHTEADRKTCLE